MSEEQLKKIIPNYFQNKQKMDEFKKEVDRDNKTIKEIMLQDKLSEFETDGIKASISVAERIDFIEEALIEYLKEKKIRGIVKKKEYVDMQLLEDALYKDKIKAADLAPFQTTKEVVTLRIKQIKDFQ